MKTEDLLYLDCRKKENANIIQKALRRLKPFLNEPIDEEIEFTLTDLSGHINKSGLLKINNINDLNVSELEKGIYIFSVKTHYETWHKELIIR